MLSVTVAKKWSRMLGNKSILHIQQNEGGLYSSTEIKGYYNDFSGKVSNTVDFDENGIPINIAAYKYMKKTILFPIAIFQYGLGSYDCFLQTNNKDYLEKSIKMGDWAVKNQNDDGAWDTFGDLNYSCKVSSMAQGEGASLLIRLYNETKDKRYIHSAESAIRFMLKDKDSLYGTSKRLNDILVLYEYPQKSPVLNGWIFSSFGLFDMWLVSKDKQYWNAWEESVRGIKAHLHKYDSGFWSFYDLDGLYASPFYHALHIELLKALNNLHPDDLFEEYIQKWAGYQNCFWGRKIAFMKKAFQKILAKILSRAF